MQFRIPLTVLALTTTVLLVGSVTMAVASPPSGVSATILARTTFDPFKVSADPGHAGRFKASAKKPIDMVVRKHSYLPGSSTGWHGHPYPVFINVIEGSLTFYEYDDPKCTPHVVTAGHGYVDSGHGHIARNESRSAGRGYQRDHGPGRCPVPVRDRRSRPALRVLTERSLGLPQGSRALLRRASPGRNRGGLRARAALREHPGRLARAPT